MTNEVITITEDEAKQIQASLIAGAEWIAVQGELINAKSISKVGNHHATSYMNRLETEQEKTNLKLKEAEPDYYIDQHTGEKMYS